MDHVKKEPQSATPADPSSLQGAKTSAETAATSGKASQSGPSTATTSGRCRGRGRGRGRARGRGRRVVPRQVSRRKPKAPQPKIEPSLASSRGDAKDKRGRGRGGRGRGGRPAVTYDPHVVGLGQIAPPRNSAKRNASGGSGTSVRSSVVSSLSAGGASSTASMYSGTSSSTGTGFDVDPMGNAYAPGVELGNIPDDGGFEQMKQNSKYMVKREDKAISFIRHTPVNEDSDDDAEDGPCELRNKELAPCAGHITENGLLMPVSLPGLRPLPIERETEREMDVDGVSQSLQCSLSPDMFPVGSVARRLLSAGDALSFMQLPGLLALEPGEDAIPFGYEPRQDKVKGQSSAAIAMAMAEKMRGLKIDMRNVGRAGATIPLGKVRFFKSGKVQIVMERGSVLNLQQGVEPKSCMQAVLIDCKEKKCEELEQSIRSRFVAVPDLSSYGQVGKAAGNGQRDITGIR